MVDQNQMCPPSISPLKMFLGVTCNIERVKLGTWSPELLGELNWSGIWFERGDLRPLFIPCISQGLFLDSALFLLYINDLSVILCNIATYADDTIPYSRYEQTC